MPLDFQLFPISFSGLDQKASALTKAPGKLERAINVVYDKAGKLSKRRGYQFVDIANNNVTLDDDVVLLGLANHHDEIIVFSYDYVLALADKDSALQRGASSLATALIQRGPNNRGNCKIHYVGTSRMSEGADGDGS